VPKPQQALTDEYGDPLAPSLSGTDPGGLQGVQLTLKEQEHRFALMMKDQMHGMEKRELERRIEDLQKTIEAKDREIGSLEDELGEQEADHRRKLNSLHNAVKVGCQGLSGVAVGLVGQFRPELAALVSQKLDGLLAGISAMPEAPALPEPERETEAEYEASGSGLSDDVFLLLQTFAPDQIMLMESLIRLVARETDPELREMLLTSALQAVAGLMAKPGTGQA
jgi:hypothetical protein